MTEKKSKCPSKAVERGGKVVKAATNPVGSPLGLISKMLYMSSEEIASEDHAYKMLYKGGGWKNKHPTRPHCQGTGIYKCMIS